MKPSTALIACTCGDALRGRLDFGRVVGAWGGAPVLITRDLCLPEGCARAAAWLRETATDSVVMAACAAPAAAPAAAAAAGRAGLEAHKVALVDVREGCAWVHPHQRSATDKAIRKIRAAAAGLSEAVPAPIPATRALCDATLIVGTSPAGAAAAARLLALGARVILLESAAGADPAPAETDRPTAEAPVRVQGTLVALEGDAGSFRARVHGPEGRPFDLTVGAVIVAGDPAPNSARPADPCAVSLADLERAQAGGAGDLLPEGQSVVFIMDDAPWPAVTESMLNAALWLARQRQCRCTVLFRDIGVAGAGLEERYREARAAGVAFIRLGASAPEVARTSDDRWDIRIEIAGLGAMTETADVVVRCTTPAPPDLDGLRRVLGIGLAADGGSLERMFHEPVFTERAGVFWIGPARGPVTADQAARQGEAAAMAAVLASGPGAAVTPVRAVVDTERCALCLTCLRVCPHHAVTIGPGPAMQVLVSACRACGVCAAACPAGAIQVLDAPGRRLLAEVDALLAPPSPEGGLVVVYACANSAVPAAQALGRLRRPYASRIELVSVPCLGRVETIHALRPLVGGAARVLLCGCFNGSCEHVVGPQRARGVAARASAVAAALGLDPSAIQVEAVAPVDWHRLASLLEAAGASTSPAEGDLVPQPAAAHVPEGAARGAD